MQPPTFCNISQNLGELLLGHTAAKKRTEELLDEKAEYYANTPCIMHERVELNNR